MRFSGVSLLSKILLGTSVALTVLFGFSGWILQDQFIRAASSSLEQEVQTSFRAYDSLWHARADRLASLSLVISRMSDVRAAFGTGDEATIRDVATELWEKISREGTMFLVADPRGRIIASLGTPPRSPITSLPILQNAAARFPNQATGFVLQDGGLYQLVITPVYVTTGGGAGLLNVLVAGFAVNAAVAEQLKRATGGSEFVFLSDGHPIVSTLPKVDISAIEHAPASGGVSPLREANIDYLQFKTLLRGVDGKPVGELHILRSFEAARRNIADLRTRVIAVWAVAMLLGLALTYALARYILRPVKALDAAAAEIAKGNYDAHVSVTGDDELGRLGRTFNDMCASIRLAQKELIRRERISTIGTLSTSIVHDLRNPLAAIYGGAEMLVDSELSPEQVERLARNIYRSSRRVQELLQELTDATRGSAHGSEPCGLLDLVSAAYAPLAASADAQSIAVAIDVPPDIELPLARSSMERVFTNLISNSIEAINENGRIRISARNGDGAVTVIVEDNGPGIPSEIRSRLFEPFVTTGKKNGIGLGLALSRQTVLDHGGDLWCDAGFSGGARFVVRIPIQHV